MATMAPACVSVEHVALYCSHDPQSFASTERYSDWAINIKSKANKRQSKNQELTFATEVPVADGTKAETVGRG